MKGKIFIDTNVIIYSFSRVEEEKRVIVRNKISELEITNKLVWSTQVIQEFCNVMINTYGKDSLEIKRSLNLFSTFELIENNPVQIKEAIDIQYQYQFSFWDSLILSSAISSSCSYILSENFTHNRKINGVEIVNPFLS